MRGWRLVKDACWCGRENDEDSAITQNFAAIESTAAATLLHKFLIFKGKSISWLHEPCTWKLFDRKSENHLFANSSTTLCCLVFLLAMAKGIQLNGKVIEPKRFDGAALAFFLK